MLLATLAFCETGLVPKGRLITYGDEICNGCDLAGSSAEIPTLIRIFLDNLKKRTFDTGLVNM